MAHLKASPLPRFLLDVQTLDDFNDGKTLGLTAGPTQVEEIIDLTSDKVAKRHWSPEISDNSWAYETASSQFNFKLSPEQVFSEK